MDEKILQIHTYDGSGFKPLVAFGAWRVAILRFLEQLVPERIDSMERHTETDEVFVLMCGQGILVLGGNQTQVDGIYLQPMQPGIIYNVKRDAWHTILLSRDAAVLLVENQDTGTHNTEYATLSPDQRRLITELPGRLTTQTEIPQ